MTRLSLCLVLLISTALAGCATSPGRLPMTDSSNSQWTVQKRSLGKLPKNGLFYAIKKEHGTWTKASNTDKGAEKLILTTDKNIFLYTKGKGEQDFFCGFSLLLPRSPGCQSRFVGKAKVSEHIGDLLFFPISVFYLSYVSFEMIQTDELVEAVQQSGILDTAKVAIENRAKSLARSQTWERQYQASQAKARRQLEALERSAYAQLILKQGVGSKICQDYKDSFGRPMQRRAFVERIENGRIQLRTSGVIYKNQPWAPVDNGQRIFWDEPGNWFPCD